MEDTKTPTIETEQLISMCTIARGQEPSKNDQLLLEIISDLTELKKVDQEDYQRCLNLLSNGINQQSTGLEPL